MKINHNLFRELLNKTKHCVPDADPRPILKYIQVTVSEKEIRLAACDGYRAALNTAAITSNENFVCYIRPLTIKADKTGALDVELTFVEKTANLTLQTEYGYQTFRFAQPTGEFPNIDKIIPPNINDKTKIAFRGGVLLSALSPFRSRNSILKCSIGAPNAPMLIESKHDSVNTQLLVLPFKWLED